MALSLKDPETDRLARTVAALTGESLTVAVRTALAERLVRENIRRGDTRSVSEKIDEIVSEFSKLPDYDTRTPDEIMGYDEYGLPT